MEDTIHNYTYEKLHKLTVPELREIAMRYGAPPHLIKGLWKWKKARLIAFCDPRPV